MPKVSDLTLQPMRHLVGYANLTKVTLAINAASAPTVKTTGTTTYVNGGIYYTKAALAAQSIAIANGYGPYGSNGYVQPVSSTVYYPIALDALGNVYLYQGTYAGQAISGQTWLGDGSVPDISPTLTPIGLIKVATNSSTTFTPGTTALDAAGLTVTYFDLALLPAMNP
jgi:hypothetical protein